MDFWEQELWDKIESGDISISLSIDGAIQGSEIPLSKAEHLRLMLESNSCNCVNCEREKAEKLARWVNYTKNLDYFPIAERIKLDLLDDFLLEELYDQGIKIDYKYGVYDSKTKTFVIANNHFIVEEDNAPQPTKEGYKNLHNSKYQVNLFQSDSKSPGKLMVYFPDRASFLWGPVLQTVLLSLLFIGITLFCFAYTIQTILRQKKLGEMKSDFINNMTHEFKTPIATISLATDSITKEGIPQFYADKIYPIDCTAAGQTLLTLTRFGEFDTAKSVASWMTLNMQDKKGGFYFRKYNTHTERTIFMRWSNAWMFVGLAYLISQTNPKV
ncbi:hypothetical protein N8684_00570 [bacterium]|nr:hypothetical protein [bacterium]